LDIVPPLRVDRFEQLEPGDLFMQWDGQRTSYALKTQPMLRGDRNAMVLLGPTFIQEVRESYIVPWQPLTVVSLGKDFSILPSLDPASWLFNGSTRAPICLAIAEDRVYVCTNGGPSPQHYMACFVEVKTGAIFERRLPGSLAAFTCDWEIVVSSPNHVPRSVIKYPLQTS
jgi:hypothetical protein